MTGDCFVFQCLRRSVDGKDLMCFQNETSVFKFVRCSVTGPQRRYLRQDKIAKPTDTVHIVPVNITSGEVRVVNLDCVKCPAMYITNQTVIPIQCLLWAIINIGMGSPKGYGLLAVLK